MGNVIINLRNMKVAAKIEDAALLDLGDGISCLEFHSKGNSVTPTIKKFIIDLMEKDLLGFDGMVIGSQNKHFSAGADLKAMLDKICNKQFYLFEDSVKAFQQMNLRIKYYHKPIVAAPYGMTLGGGLEVALHCSRRVAREKCNMGLVEVGVGLLPSGGGTKEAALCMDGLATDRDSEAICTIFERLLMGVVSKNARHAVQMGYLYDTDVIVSDSDTQLDIAKETCLSLARQGRVKEASSGATLPGQASYKMMVSRAEQLLEAGKIAPHDLYIGKHIALVLAGSANDSSAFYSEQQILDIERACFINLLQNAKTQERIASFLNTGKKLIN